jgi:hypothetical protein
MFRIRCHFFRIFLLSVFSAVPAIIHSQEAEHSANQTENFDQNESRSSLFAGTGVGNNLVLASSLSHHQQFYYGSLTYGFNNKIYLSASSFHLPGFSPFMAFHTFSLNYSHGFTDWLDVSLTGSRYQIAGNLSDTLFKSFFYGDFTLGLDWRILYSKISVNRLISETNSTFFQLRNSRYIQASAFPGKEAYIYFDPYINLLAGSLTRIKSDEGTSVGISSSLGSFGQGPSGMAPVNVPRPGPGTAPGTGTGTNTSIVTSVFFGLMEISMGLPVGINLGRLTLEAEPGYVIPMYDDPSIPSPKGFTFLFNCYIQIF